MHMSEEERERTIDDIDELIRLAKYAGVMAELGTDDEYATLRSHGTRKQKQDTFRKIESRQTHQYPYFRIITHYSIVGG